MVGTYLQWESLPMIISTNITFEEHGRDEKEELVAILNRLVHLSHGGLVMR